MSDATEYTTVDTPSGGSGSAPIPFDERNFEPTDGDDIPQILEEADNYYQLLDVEPSATDEKIVERTYELMNEWHPDNCDQHGGKLVFKQINRARKILTHEQKRAIYNKLGHKQYVDRARRGNISEQVVKQQSRQTEARDRNSTQDTTQTASGIEREQRRRKQQEREMDTQISSSSDIFDPLEVDTINENITDNELYGMSVHYLYKQLWSYKIMLFGAGFVLYNFLTIASLQLLPQNIVQLSGVPITLVGLLYGLYIAAVTTVMYSLVNEAEAVAPDEFRQESEEKIAFEKGQSASRQTTQTNAHTGVIDYSTGNVYEPNESTQSESSNSDAIDTSSNSESEYSSNNLLLSDTISVSICITVTIIILGIGAVTTKASTVGVVEFLFEVFSGDGPSIGTLLWVDGIEILPTSSLVSMQILLSLEIVLLAAYALTTFWHSFTKRVWTDKYMRGLDVSPTKYEVAISSIPVVLSGGIVTGTVRLTSTKAYSTTPVVSQDGSLTGGSMLFVGCMYIIVVAYYYKLRDAT